MRILFICHEHPPLGGGGGNAAAQVSKHLVKLGNDVLFLTSGFRGLPPEGSVNGYRTVSVDINRKSKAGCTVYELIKFAFIGHSRAKKLASTFKPDVILSFFTIPSGYIARKLSKSLKIPFALSLRGGDVPGFLKEELGFYQLMAKPLIKSIWKNAALVTTNCSYLAGLAKNTLDRHFEVIPNGYYTEDFSPDYTQRPKDRINFLFAGRLVYQKGIDTLIEAAAGLKNNNFRLTIIGSGPLENTLKRRVKELNIESKIEFAGWIDKTKMLQYYRSSHAFILPSRDEGMPNVLNEAAACGLALIASNSGGIPEIVKNCYNGYLFSPGDAGGLTKILEKLLKNPGELNTLGENARKTAQSWTWAEAAVKLNNLLSGMVKK